MVHVLLTQVVEDSTETYIRDSTVTAIHMQYLNPGHMKIIH